MRENSKVKETVKAAKLVKRGVTSPKKVAKPKGGKGLTVKVGEKKISSPSLASEIDKLGEKGIKKESKRVVKAGKNLKNSGKIAKKKSPAIKGKKELKSLTNRGKKLEVSKSSIKGSSKSEITTSKSKKFTTPRAENIGYRDKNILLHGNWVRATQELEAANRKKDKVAIARAENRLAVVKNEFYEGNKGLAYSMARAFLSQSADLGQDYLSAASLGLWEAFLKWDPTLNVTFATYSRTYIKGRISRTVRQSEYHYISQGDFNKRKEVREAATRLQEKLDRNPTYEEIAREAGVTPMLVERALQNKASSLDAKIGDGENTVGELIADKFVHNQGSDHEEEKIEKMLLELGETELWILLGRGDVLGVESQSLVDIADRIGIGREIARRIEMRAKYRLMQAKMALEEERLPEIAEVAKACGVSIETSEEFESFKKMLRSGYSELKGRWIRASLSYKIAVHKNDEVKNMVNARLDRIGEEFIASAEKVILQIANTFSEKGSREPLGVDKVTFLLWDLLGQWDPRSGMSFEAFARIQVSSQYSRVSAKSFDNQGLTYLEVAYLWNKIKRRNKHLFSV